MALLLAPLGGNAGEWLRVFATELPGLEIRVWPDIGNPADIDVAAVAHPPHGLLASLPNLCLIASLMAGQEAILGDPTLPRDVPIVRTGDPDGDALMNETALLHVLRHHCYVPEYRLQQQRHEWKRLPRLSASERKVGVMGLGLIGLAVAKMLRDHGFRVAGWARHAKEIDGIETLHGGDQLAAFLGRSEILVNLVALTPETVGILNRDRFSLLPKGAAVINLARGQHIVDDDLIAALDAGQLSSATLDVYHQEPLPKDSPLWAHPRITVMPHVSRRIEAAQVVPHIAENVRRLQQGRPFVQLVNRAAGY